MPKTSVRDFTTMNIMGSAGDVANTEEPILMELFVNPVKTPFGHVFDTESLDKHIQLQIDIQTEVNCPCCRNPIVLEYKEIDEDPENTWFEHISQQGAISAIIKPLRKRLSNPILIVKTG